MKKLVDLMFAYWNAHGWANNGDGYQEAKRGQNPPLCVLNCGDILSRRHEMRDEKELNNLRHAFYRRGIYEIAKWNDRQHSVDAVKQMILSVVNEESTDGQETQSSLPSP